MTSLQLRVLTVMKILAVVSFLTAIAATCWYVFHVMRYL